MRCSILAGLVLGCFATPQSSAGDWPGWRGPTGNGVAAEGERPPTTWGADQNVLWKTPVPGRGHSSPVVVGDRVVVTTADERTQVQSVFCVARDSGKPLWKTDINKGGFPKAHPHNTFATPTVASDGERIFAVFQHHDRVELDALSLDGKVLWRKLTGPYLARRYQYGYASSPVLYAGTVIVTSDFDGQAYIAAFDQKTGREVWRTARPGGISYSSPVVAVVAGREQLLMPGCDQVISYDPKTGEQLWAQKAITTVTAGTVVWDGDLIFASGGFPQSETAALKGDGTGGVWRNRQQCYEQSMLAHDGYLYAVNDNGIAFCWKADDGTEMWSERLAGPVSASPVLAGGNIFVTNERGRTFVFRATPDGFESVATNQLGDETFASLAVCDGKLYIRAADSSSGTRQETLYCIAEPRQPPE